MDMTRERAGWSVSRSHETATGIKGPLKIVASLDECQDHLLDTITAVERRTSLVWLRDKDMIKSLWNDHDRNKCEGYVVRPAGSFSYSEFRKCVGKFVRNDHIQTTKHWMHGQPLVKNILRSDANHRL